MLEPLLDAGTEANPTIDNGATALASLRTNALPVAEIPLAHGADVSAMRHKGIPPLTNANLPDFTELMTLLVSHGADINQAHVTVYTPLILAISLWANKKTFINYPVTAGYFADVA